MNDTGSSMGFVGISQVQSQEHLYDSPLSGRDGAGSLAELSASSPHPSAAGRRNRRQRRRGVGAIRIVSATYGPSDGRRLLDGTVTSSREARDPHTRDVLPVMRALLEMRGYAAGGAMAAAVDRDDGSCLSPSSSDHNSSAQFSSDDENGNMVQVLAEGNSRRKVAVPIMDGKSMNALFGDPCPGTTKSLRISYVFGDEIDVVDDDDGVGRSPGGVKRGDSKKISRSSFQEHERVVLRRVVTFYQDEARLKRAVAAKKDQENSMLQAISSGSNNSSEEKKTGRSGESEGNVSMMEKSEDDDDEFTTLRWARRMGRSQSISEMMVHTNGSPLRSPLPSSSSLTGLSMISEGAESSTAISSKVGSTHQVASEGRKLQKWRLRSSTSEIVLPIILPYLGIRQRAICQLACKCWRFVVRNQGVASCIDLNDPYFINFTRQFLRQIIAHSYSSLAQLFLNDFSQLTTGDLHPAISHLRKLRTLDISRCQQLDDSTLVLLSENVAETLQVLYMKGLSRITDRGLMAICATCHRLRVLEISNVPITDESGIAIGENLAKLEALYMRDNFRLTNKSIDVITKKCMKLTQLTLWGCTRMRHLSLGPADNNVALPPLVPSGCDKLVLLNLWGCHGLVDESASSIGMLKNLRSLIVSECHKLTDRFLIMLAQTIPNIQHLHLRYVRRITDASVDAIAANMHHISSLDLSFCTRITHQSLVNLLETRYMTLSELRLYSCHQLDMTVPLLQQQQRNIAQRDESVAQLLLDAIKLHGHDNCLNILDVRGCKSEPRRGAVPRGDDQVFIRGMAGVKFEQKIPGFFVRPARWNSDVQKRLAQQLIMDTTRRIL